MRDTREHGGTLLAAFGVGISVLVVSARGDLADCAAPRVASVPKGTGFKALAERCKPCCRVEVYLGVKGFKLPLDVREPWPDVRCDFLTKVFCAQERAC